jgi:hypothetical protein
LKVDEDQHQDDKKEKSKSEDSLLERYLIGWPFRMVLLQLQNIIRVGSHFT